MDQAVTKSGSTGKNLVIAVLVIVVVGLLLILTMNQGGGTGAQEPVALATESAAAEPSETMDPELEEFLLSLAYRVEGDPMAKGAVDAPVTIVEWADYECGYCNMWATETMPQLQGYVDDGTLRIEFRDLALFGDGSVAAAAAARAAGEQDLFWEYHDALHAVLHTNQDMAVSPDLLVTVAEAVGVPDLERFDADRASAAIQQSVLSQSDMARQIGITSTPTFLLGTELVRGAQPAEVFQEIIERQAAASR